MLVRLDRVSKVSAVQLIQRAAQAEDRQVRPMAETEIYRKLRVVRRVSGTPRRDSVNFETWSDPIHSHFSRRVLTDGQLRSVLSGPDLAAKRHERSRSPYVPPLLKDLEQVFHAN